MCVLPKDRFAVGNSLSATSLATMREVHKPSQIVFANRPFLSKYILY